MCQTLRENPFLETITKTNGYEYEMPDQPTMEGQSAKTHVLG